LGFSEALLGMMTALGADAPEISSAVAAIVAGHKSTGVGVVIGSNVFNIAALLGLSALIAGRVRISVHGLVLSGAVALLAALFGIPNVVAAIRLALHGRGAACVSESLNSNNANLLVGLCIPALALGIGRPSGLERFAALSMLALTGIACLLAYSGGGLTRREGAAII